MPETIRSSPLYSFTVVDGPDQMTIFFGGGFYHWGLRVTPEPPRATNEWQLIPGLLQELLGGDALIIFKAGDLSSHGKTSWALG
jgi:hypothetical protein